MTISCVSGIFQVRQEVIGIEVNHGDAIPVQAQQERDPVHAGQLRGYAGGKAFHLEQLDGHGHLGFLLEVRSRLLHGVGQ